MKDDVCLCNFLDTIPLSYSSITSATLLLWHWRKVVVSDMETALSSVYTPGARVLRIHLDTREQAANKEELEETYCPFDNHKNNSTRLKARKDASQAA